MATSKKPKYSHHEIYEALDEISRKLAFAAKTSNEEGDMMTYIMKRYRDAYFIIHCYLLGMPAGAVRDLYVGENASRDVLHPHAQSLDTVVLAVDQQLHLRDYAVMVRSHAARLSVVLAHIADYVRSQDLQNVAFELRHAKDLVTQLLWRTTVHYLNSGKRKTPDFLVRTTTLPKMGTPKDTPAGQTA